MPRIAAFREKLRGTLAEDAFFVDEDFRTGVRFSVRVAMGELRHITALCNESAFYLETLTALDFQDTLELVYHFNCYEPRSRFALRVLCGHDETPPTVSDIFRCAGWLEREVHEFFGVVFSGNPDLRRLLLPEDSEDNPLRKNFGVVGAYRKREEVYG